MKLHAVFLDTFALLALTNSQDALHAQAAAVQDRLHAENAVLMTSEWVLTEYLNHTSSRPRRAVGIAAVRALLNSPNTTIEPATSQLWTEAFTLYRSRADKEWSLVDCTSMLLCRKLRFKRVFTHDKHFRQAGLETLL